MTFFRDHQPMYVSDSIDQLLTVLFMLVAVAAFVIFFTISDRTIFLYVGGVAVVLRLFQYGRRYYMKRKLRKERKQSLENEISKKDI
ncbi:hypothetical protein [Porphyromonas somerae]|uniref:hypothetical protein n=2 Tax=Porphyromonas TaxID=836 RepID=UPI001FD4F72B|nr:hypothetical protein [Porphyromonas somerae]